MDIFSEKSARPMLIGRTEDAFDDDGYIYELKLDGERCLAYLGEGETFLANQRGTPLLQRLPELAGLHKAVKQNCILDGELIVARNGRPDFEEIKSRAALKDPLRIQIASKRSPASLVVFDILYHKNAAVLDSPLMQRKELLESVVQENRQLSLSRYVQQHGIVLFQQAGAHGLEGVVGKRMNSLYRMGKRTKDWVKCKQVQDDEFVICGYIQDAKYVASLVLGQYSMQGKLLYRGHVTLAISSGDFAAVKALPKRKTAPIGGTLPPGNQNAIWVQPRLVCTVQYLMKGTAGLMRHPVYKGLREDKHPKDIVDATVRETPLQ